MRFASCQSMSFQRKQEIHPPERRDIPGGSSNQPIRQAIASANRAQLVRRPSQTPAAGTWSPHSERDISFLMDLGVTREIAIKYCKYAANSLLFYSIPYKNQTDSTCKSSVYLIYSNTKDWEIMGIQYNTLQLESSNKGRRDPSYQANSSPYETASPVGHSSRTVMRPLALHPSECILNMFWP